MNFTIKIHPREVGKIIGSKGSTIKSLQQEYNVKISISKENGQVSQHVKIEKVNN